MNSIILVEILFLLCISVVSDALTYKIKNQIVISFLLVGFATNTVLFGFGGIRASLAGAVLPVILLFVLFVLRMLGAGDIKLLSALGAIAGYPLILKILPVVFISGGIIALLIMIFRKNAKQRFKHLVMYLKLCLVTLSIQPYTDFGVKKDGSKLRFSYAIAVGTVITIIGEYYGIHCL
ncbi:MAG: A24 family peptidase [Bacillota bacterium]